MRAYGFFLSVGTLFLAGCGTHLPALVDTQILPVKDLVADIDCEFQDAVRTQIYEKHRYFLKTWQGTYTITLKGNETGVVKLASSTTPILLPRGSTLNLGAGGGATTTANRTAVLKFNLDFATVKDGPPCLRPAPVSGHPMLTGKIGFEQWMDRAFDGALADDTLSAKTSAIASVGHTFQFSLDLIANASPSFSIVPAPVTTITPTGSIDRLEDNIVDVALGKGAGATESVTKTSAQYAKAQIDAISELNKAIEELTAKIKKGGETLAENKDFIAQGNELKPFNVPEAKIQELFPEGDKDHLTKQQNAARSFFRDPTVEAKLQSLNNLAANVREDQRARDAKKGQLLDTINHPASQAVVQRQVRTVSPISPDQNPNVANTQLQLTLERLNNTLRLPVP
jgi:hypothetical protein